MFPNAPLTPPDRIPRRHQTLPAGSSHDRPRRLASTRGAQPAILSFFQAPQRADRISAALSLCPPGFAEVKTDASGVSVSYTDAKGAAHKLDADRLIVSIGRVPNTDGLGAENVGLKLDARGFIEVDKNCRTALPRVFAIGDVVRGPMLAHKGEDEGVMVAEIIAGQHGHVNYDAVANVVSSNLAFDADLRRRDPSWGLRSVEEFAAEKAKLVGD